MSRPARVPEPFGLVEFAVRLVAALVMVLATWNPAGYSYMDWVATAWDAGTLGALHALLGVVMLIGWVILLRATFNSLGVLGVVLGGLLLGTAVWVLFDFGLLERGSASLFAWIIMICVGILLAIGLSGSYLWKRMTGQLDVDDFDGG